MEKTFWDAAEDDKVEKMKSILRKNPSLNVNWMNEERKANAALHAACAYGHSSVVSILLAHPDTDPNLKERDGETPFKWACFSGSTSCVRLLLQDQRVIVNEPSDYGRTPLWQAANRGHLDILKWWIASGREMDLWTPGDSMTDVIGGAKKGGQTEVMTLLGRFKSDAVLPTLP